MFNIDETFQSDEIRDPNRFSIKIYDENHEAIENPDLEKGWLEYTNGEQNEYGEWRMTQIYHPYTQDELEKITLQKEREKLFENRRPLSQDEVVSLFLHKIINEIDIPDQLSLRMVDYYPTIDEVIGLTVRMGFKFTSGGKLYKTIQPDVTIKTIVLPDDRADTIYEEIRFNYTGKIYDPIPHDGYIKLESGKYYTQLGKIYLCKKSSNGYINCPLVELVGEFLDVINKELTI